MVLRVHSHHGLRQDIAAVRIIERARNRSRWKERDHSGTHHLETRAGFLRHHEAAKALGETGKERARSTKLPCGGIS